jgi:hypothetical protein
MKGNSRFGMWDIVNVLFWKAVSTTTIFILQEKLHQDFYLANKNCGRDSTSVVTWLERTYFILLLRLHFLFPPYSERNSNSKNQHYYPKAVLCNFDSPGRADVDIKGKTQRSTSVRKLWMEGKPYIPQRSCCNEAKLKSNRAQRTGRKERLLRQHHPAAEHKTGRPASAL